MVVLAEGSASVTVTATLDVEPATVSSISAAPAMPEPSLGPRATVNVPLGMLVEPSRLSLTSLAMTSPTQRPATEPPLVVKGISRLVPRAEEAN